PQEQEGTVAIFAKNVVPERTGRLGYALRVSPNHFDDPLTRPCNSLLKWNTAGEGPELPQVHRLQRGAGKDLFLPNLFPCGAVHPPRRPNTPDPPSPGQHG